MASLMTSTSQYKSGSYLRTTRALAPASALYLLNLRRSANGNYYGPPSCPSDIFSIVRYDKTLAPDHLAPNEGAQYLAVKYMADPGNQYVVVGVDPMPHPQMVSFSAGRTLIRQISPLIDGILARNPKQTHVILEGVTHLGLWAFLEWLQTDGFWIKNPLIEHTAIDAWLAGHRLEIPKLVSLAKSHLLRIYVTDVGQPTHRKISNVPP